MIRALLFDLGGVLLPFDRERRVAAIVAALGVAPDAVRDLFAGDLPGRMDLGAADERDFAATFAALAGRDVSADQAIELLLSVFEPPNLALWDLAERLRGRLLVGGFSDNPAFVTRVFPAGRTLAPMFFSSELRACKPSAEAFAAVEAALALPAADVLFVDDSMPNVDAALARGWDAIHYTGNAALLPDLAARGLV